MFIHVTIRNLIMWLSYTELKITAGFSIKCVVCPINLFSEICNDIQSNLTSNSLVLLKQDSYIK